MIEQGFRDFFRIVRTTPPTRVDFEPNVGLNRAAPDDPEEARLMDGLSMFSTFNQARRKRRVSPALGRYVATVRVPLDGSIRVERTRGEGHHTIWGDPDTLLKRACAAVNIGCDRPYLVGGADRRHKMSCSPGSPSRETRLEKQRQPPPVVARSQPSCNLLGRCSCRSCDPLRKPRERPAVTARVLGGILPVPVQMGGRRLHDPRALRPGVGIMCVHIGHAFASSATATTTSTTRLRSCRDNRLKMLTMNMRA